jgi:hypothetical protein
MSATSSLQQVRVESLRQSNQEQVRYHRLRRAAA